MKYKTIITDQNLLEQIRYPSESFPICFCVDYLDDFLHGEIGYHWHDDFEFGLVLHGEMEYYIHQGSDRQESCILKEGDGVFINSRLLHKMRQTVPGTALFSFVIPVNFFFQLPMREIYQKDVLPVVRSSAAWVCFQSGSPNDREFLESLKEIQGLPPDQKGYELYCIELVCRLWRLLLNRVAQMKEVSQASKGNQKQEERLRLMLSYIHSHYGEDITIDTIAQAVNISRSECFRCFRLIIGKSPLEYLCQYRISQAANLLSYTDRKLADICYSCGFKSPSYFGKVFRENFGMSPGQYRKENLKKQRDIY
ncbi:MAG: AraC family transcriptional regulator [Lachnospiraceae bacterium]|nr:AraC family transcriptional regulator [Lachnospiraceae bacterium]